MTVPAVSDRKIYLLAFDRTTSLDILGQAFKILPEDCTIVSCEMSEEDGLNYLVLHSESFPYVSYDKNPHRLKIFATFDVNRKLVITKITYPDPVSGYERVLAHR